MSYFRTARRRRLASALSSCYIIYLVILIGAKNHTHTHTHADCEWGNNAERPKTIELATHLCSVVELARKWRCQNGRMAASRSRQMTVMCGAYANKRNIRIYTRALTQYTHSCKLCAKDLDRARNDTRHSQRRPTPKRVKEDRQISIFIFISM